MTAREARPLRLPLSCFVCRMGRGDGHRVECEYSTESCWTSVLWATKHKNTHVQKLQSCSSKHTYLHRETQKQPGNTKRT